MKSEANEITTTSATIYAMTQFLYGNLSQPFQVAASRAPDNTLTVYYYDDYGALYAFDRDGARYYVGSDHLGTPKVVTDNTGAVIKSWEYDSWGVRTPLVDNDPTLDLPIGFAGGIPDDVTGLVRFGFRDYEPGTGRWAAKDPVFFGGGWNLYLFVGNDPVNKVDRSGLCDRASLIANYGKRGTFYYNGKIYDSEGNVYDAGTIDPSYYTDAGIVVGLTAGIVAGAGAVAEIVSVIKAVVENPEAAFYAYGPQVAGKVMDFINGKWGGTPPSNPGESMVAIRDAIKNWFIRKHDEDNRR